MRIRSIAIVLAALAVCGVADASEHAALLLAQSGAAPAQSSVAGRLPNVERLIESSSGARQVEASSNAEAAARREEARRMYRDALAAHGAGDDARAKTLLDDATRTMFEAVRLAGAPASIEQKKKDDFAARAESVGVLLEALDRIGKEKGKQALTDKTRAEVDALVAQARRLEGSGRVDDGRARLDEAYDVAKRAIEELRGGETLVRSLNFASKEEEYHYELDRNDTHRMLVDVLTQEKRGRQGVDKMLDTFVGRAAALRADAEKQAAGGDYAGAVETLEKSTKEFIRAIRSTGVYIPG